MNVTLHKPLAEPEPDPLVVFLTTMKEALRPIVAELVAESREYRWEWMSAAQAGEVLGLDTETVAARVRRGTLPGAVHARRVYVDMREFDRQLQRASKQQHR